MSAFQNVTSSEKCYSLGLTEWKVLFQFRGLQNKTEKAKTNEKGCGNSSSSSSPIRFSDVCQYLFSLRNLEENLKSKSCICWKWLPSLAAPVDTIGFMAIEKNEDEKKRLLEHEFWLLLKRGCSNVVLHFSSSLLLQICRGRYLVLKYISTAWPQIYSHMIKPAGSLWQCGFNHADCRLLLSQQHGFAE